MSGIWETASTDNGDKKWQITHAHIALTVTHAGLGVIISLSLLSNNRELLILI